MLQLAILLAVSFPHTGVELQSVQRGEVTARATVRIADRGLAPGRGRASFTLTVEGPITLQVEGPRLEDALAAWRIGWQASSWSADKIATWEISIGLAQLKPGAMPLPGLRLRVRARPVDEWQDVSWLDPLHEPRDVAPIVELPPLPPSAWHRHVLKAAIVAIPLLVLATIAWWVRRRESSAPPEPASRRALARLSDHASVEQMSAVVRGFLQEQSGLPAARLTTVELIVALEARGDVSAESVVELRHLLELGDLVKFAGHSPTDAERVLALQQGRAVVEAVATWPPGEKDAIGEVG